MSKIFKMNKQELIAKIFALLEQVDCNDKCLYSGPNGCSWQGSESEMFAHFEEKHEDFVLKKPYTIAIDGKHSSNNHYFLTAGDVLYLIQVQVCLKAMNIYYSVRLFEDRKDFTMYTLRVMADNKAVASTTQLTLAGENRIETGIKHLESIFKGSKFIFELNFVTEPTETTLKRKVSPICARTSAKQQKMEMSCQKCSRNITEDLAYKLAMFTQEWLCANCIDDPTQCRHCTFFDTSSKMCLHKQYYCHDNNSSAQVNCIRAKNGIVTVRFEEPRVIMVESDYGILYGILKYENSHLNLRIVSEVPQGFLHTYVCTAELHNWDSSITMPREMNVNSFKYPWDWITFISYADINRYIEDGKFKIKVTLKKL